MTGALLLAAAFNVGFLPPIEHSDCEVSTNGLPEVCVFTCLSAKMHLPRSGQVPRRARCARREAVGSGERSELRSSRKAPREELSRSESRKRVRVTTP